jgi:dipeptide/tripeptide permease
VSDKEKKRLNLGKTNFAILILALILLVLGYIIMAQNEITVSPIILAIAYAIIIPFGLLYKPKNKD